MFNFDIGFVLLMLLAVMDLAVLGTLVFFMKTMKASGRNESVRKTAEVLEALAADSAKVAEHWRVQIEGKQQLMRRLSEEMDQKVVSLKLLCSRAEALARSSRAPEGAGLQSPSLTGRERKIISLARTGRNTEEIADRLDLSRREVDLVLGLERKLACLGTEKRAS
jgi:DNA-binding NarL/FixJ family response regulator